MTKTIAVDFDGTMNKYLEWGDGSIKNEPLDGCIETLKAFHEAGYNVVVFTTRVNPAVNGAIASYDQRVMLREWLIKNDLNFVEIDILGKPLAEIYIDDRAITFNNNWPEISQLVLEKLKK